MAKSGTTDSEHIMIDLTWIDTLKGIAIIGVFFDNWTGYMKFQTTPALLYSLAKAFALAVGPFVQVLFILSGFGLTLMAFLIGPPLRVPTNAIIVLALGGVYIIATFFLSYSISQPMDKFTSWLYRLFFPPYQRAIAPLTGGEKGVVVDISGEVSFRTLSMTQFCARKDAIQG
jgi:hypothetical protein